MNRILAHAHSDWSHDGRIRLEDWPAVAESAGCDTVLLTEHEESGWTAERYANYASACERASTALVRLVAGIEFLQDGQHVLCYGLRSWPARPASAAELAAAVADQGCFLCLAHPAKYAWRPAPGLRAAVQAIEVWNSKWIYDGVLGPHPRTLSLARDKLLLVGQDVHALKHLSSLVLEAEGQDILAELRAGRYHIAESDRRWTPEQLRTLRTRQAAQRLRTTALGAALASRRWLRHLRPPTTA